MVALKVSSRGLAIVKQARKAKGWTIDDWRWLEAASEILGISWAETGYFADGISEGTWKRFLSGKYAVNVDAFRAFCQVLGLQWQEIVDRDNHQDWGEEIDVSVFFGRSPEIATLKQYILQDRCRLVALLGMGGIGKTSLAIKTARLIDRQFEFIIWRSLKNTPSVEKILEDLIQFFSQQQQQDLPDPLDRKISLLLQYLRSSRCLLILDNLESILQSGSEQNFSSLQVKYRSDRENYSYLFRAIAESNHQSCLILTSREALPELASWEGDNLPIRCLQLSGLSKIEGQKLLAAKGTFQGTKLEWQTLVDRYGGNPLALKIVSTTIQDFFRGNLTDFLQILQRDSFIFPDIYDLLQQQFNRLSFLEQQVLYWLAINREPLTIQELQQDFINPVSSRILLRSLAALQKRSLIEKSENYWGLQTVVIEYVTYELIIKIAEEIQTTNINLFNKIALVKVQSKNYLRSSQEIQILKPVADKLLEFFGTKQQLKQQLLKIIKTVQTTSDRRLKRGYLSGNVINLLRLLKIDLQGLDFSELAIWQANLQGLKLHQVNFAQTDLSKSIFTETLGNILSATFSPDGQILVTCDTDCQIRLWETNTGKLLIICQGHTNWVRSVAFSPDGKILASAGADCSVKLWQVRDGMCVKTCLGHQNEIFAVAFSPDNQTLVSASGDCQLRLWDVITGKCLKVFKGHQGCVRSVSFNSNGITFASGSDDRTIKIWDVTTGKCLNTWTEHQASVRSIAFSPDGITLASGSSDRTVKIWEVTTGQCLDTYLQHSDGVSAVTFSPDGVTLATGSSDRTVRLWNYHTGTCLRTVYGHANQIFSLDFSPDGQTIVCASLDRTMKIWDCQDGKCLKTWKGSTDWVVPVAFNSQGNLIASGSNDCTIRIWDWEKNYCLQTLTGHQDLVTSLAFHPQEKILASASRDRTIRFWNLATGHCHQILQGHEDWVYTLAFSPDGQTLASGSADTTAKLWNMTTGVCLQTFSGHTNQVWSVAFSPDGHTFATGSTDCLIRLWNITNNKLLQILVGHKNRVKSIAFHPRNPHLLVSGSTDNAIALWDCRRGKLIKSFQGHNNWVFAVAFSPDGHILASVSHDRTVRLWDIQTGKCLHICQGHKHLVSAVAFHPNGQMVASGSQDQSIRLWDTQTGKCLQILRTARLYEEMNITGTEGLTPAQKTALQALGCVTDSSVAIKLTSKKIYS